MNNIVEDFHVTTETADRPRFKSGHSTRPGEMSKLNLFHISRLQKLCFMQLLDDIQALAGHGSGIHWDGPLGGGNDFLRRGSINGWFFGHKSGVMVWDMYLDPNNCKKIDNIVETCGSHRVGHHKGRAGKLRKVIRHNATGIICSTTSRFISLLLFV